MASCLIIYYLFISNKDPYHSLLRDEGTCRAFIRIRPQAPSLTLIISYPVLVQYIWPALRWAKESWDWWWKQDVSGFWALYPSMAIVAFVLTWYFSHCTVVPSSNAEWDRKLAVKSWARTTTATCSRLLAETTNRDSLWSKVSWETAEHASSSRKVSVTVHL